MPRFLEYVEQGARQLRMALSQLPLERDDVHDGEVPLGLEVALLLRAHIRKETQHIWVAGEEWMRWMRPEISVDLPALQTTIDIGRARFLELYVSWQVDLERLRTRGNPRDR